MKNLKYLLTFLIVTTAFWGCQQKETFLKKGDKISFNDNWEFTKSPLVIDYFETDTTPSAIAWENISLPHTAQIEPLVTTESQYQGTCFYRKYFTVDKNANNKHLALYFEGAMQVADIYLNNQLIATHDGGYLPFYVELNKYLKYGKENCVIVKLNNEDNSSVPPGKALNVLDFNYYSGIYRNVWLIKKDKLHITNSNNANKIAGGGIFVSYSNVTNQIADINVKIEVKNENESVKSTTVALALKYKGQIVKEITSNANDIVTNQCNTFNLSFNVDRPQLWSPAHPELYQLEVKVLSNGNVTDTEIENIGIRTFSFSTKDGFILNGEPLKLRGTNRHQEYPYVGYAISDNANYRDAYKIKSAGFNFVRLSHYPQTESFLKACDELGILVMDAIPGWQFFGDSVFQKNSISDVRQMVRRDRNHPSIILWESSLNESWMSDDFLRKAKQAVHEEYPGDDVYTCGWMDSIYDVFIPARQHAKAPDYWNKYCKNKPLLIAEYGDWEYYAQNAGFNQKTYQDLTAEERTSRQFRGNGQKRLGQQALNYQEALNSNLQGPAVGDANWLMFDYNRGYAPDIESSGIMDIFRLPKFAYYFYQSQASASGENDDPFYQPMVYIANYYNDPSYLSIKVYSNCDQVELFLNGESIEKRSPDNDIYSTHLNHPPFTFNLKSFVPGQLLAKGYINGKEAARFIVQTPQDAQSIKLWIDESGKPLQKDCNDLVFVYAAVIDQNGTIIPDAENSIKFNVTGPAELIGKNPINAEAGIATILLKAGSDNAEVQISANADGLKPAQLLITPK